MANWTEMWTFGNGATRVYCGVARTEDGFAVDLFCGDVCVDSWIFGTRQAAVKAALDLERQHSGGIAQPAVDFTSRVPRGVRQRLVAH